MTTINIEVIFFIIFLHFFCDQKNFFDLSKSTNLSFIEIFPHRKIALSYRIFQLLTSVISKLLEVMYKIPLDRELSGTF